LRARGTELGLKEPESLDDLVVIVFIFEAVVDPHLII
jgi:hypothetical protein